VIVIHRFSIAFRPLYCLLAAADML